MRLILFTLLSSLLLIANAQRLDSKKKKKIDRLINEQINTKLSPGLAVGIVQDGAIIYESYAGFSDLKNKIPISKTARFNYASSGKQFTALAILNLIEEGQIRLDDDIRKFLPNFYSDIDKRIEIRHLLTHTSGIRDVYGLWNLQGITWWEKTLGNPDAIKLLSKQEQLNFNPGDQHMYSNSNYILLTEIIRKVTSNSFEYYSTGLFKDLGMTNTAFESDHSDIPQRVLPYGFWKKYRMYEWNSELIGDGALFTTLPDQLAWEVMVQQENSSALSPELIQKSQLPISKSGTKKYGYGLEIEEGRTFHHGSTGAYGATFARYQKENLSIVVMTNYNNISTSGLTDKCYEILSGSSKISSSRKPESIGNFVSIDSLVGTYKTPFGYYYRFVTVEDSLFLERTNREPVALEHEKGNIYHEINDPAFQLAFTTDPELGMQITAHYPTHDPYTLTKQTQDWQGYNYLKLNGTYNNAELGLQLSIRYLEEDRYLIKHNRNEFEAQIFEPDVIWFDGYKAEFTLSNERAIEVLVNSGRNRNISFIRSE